MARARTRRRPPPRPPGPGRSRTTAARPPRPTRCPSNIVAFTGVAAALHDYGVEVKGVFGPTTTKDGKADVQAGDLDVTKVTVLGNEWGQFNIEKYAALAPDLLVTTMFDSAGTLWYVPEESKEKILAVGAPTVGISVFDIQLDQPLQRMLELAKTLGADTASAKVTAAKKAFEDAAARLRAATKAKPNIKVLVGSASQDIFYVSGSNLSVDLEYFKALGVNFVEPSADALKASGGWYENLSWENVDKYRADIIMMDNRTSAIQPARHHRGDLEAVARGEGGAGHRAQSRADSVVRQVHAAAHEPRRGDREREEGRLTPGALNLRRECACSWGAAGPLWLVAQFPAPLSGRVIASPDDSHQESA